MEYVAEFDYGPSFPGKNNHDFGDCEDNRMFCCQCVDIIEGNGDPKWPYDVKCCYRCNEEVGEDNELPFKEITGLFYCENCEGITKIQAAFRGYLSRKVYE